MLRTRLVLVCLAVLVTAIPSVAQPEGTTGWHLVRPGDTLEEITAHYIGLGEVWPENHALNPEMQNPHRIYPGDRVLVTLREGIPAGSAQITGVANGVDEQPMPIAWQSAQEQDLLQERDGLRTADDSSAVLRFGDGTELSVTEDSLVFLQSGSAPDQAVERRGAVQIVVGQADLAGRNLSGSDSPVEIVLGDTTARPAADSSGTVATRARRSDAGSGHVMVYAGSSVVASEASEVALDAGQGSVISEGGAVGTPEALLAAPVLRTPTDGAKLGSSPMLRWNAVPDADGYAIEVCEDEACGRLVRRITDLDATETSDLDLAPGQYSWRVTAVASSGLDGYPAQASTFEIVDDPSLLEPPTATVSGVGTVLGYGTALALTDTSQVAVEIDDPSGTPTVNPTLNGAPVTMAEIESGWDEGEHVIGGTIVSAAGVEATLGPTTIIVDATPPEIGWEVGGLELLHANGLDQGHDPKAPRKWRKKASLFISPDGRTWTPLIEPGQTTARHIVSCDDPQFFVWASREVQLPDRVVPKNRVARAWSFDELTATRELVLEVDFSSDQYRLTISTEDILGNGASAEWTSGG